MAKRRFVRDVAGVFNSNVFSLAVGLLLSILLTRELGPEGFGLFTALIIIPMIVASLTNLGVRAASIYLIGKGKYADQDIVSSVMSMLIITSIAGIIISTGAYFIYSAPGFTWLLILLVLAVIPLRLAVIYIGGIFLGKDEIRKANQLNWPINLINLALAVILVWGLKMDVMGAVLAALLANLAISVYAISSLGKMFSLAVRFNRTIIREMLKLGVVYSLAFFVVVLNYRIDIVLLERLKDLREVGIYSLSVHIAEQLWQIPLAISIVIFSRTANEEDYRQMTPRTMRLVRISLVLTILLSVTIIFIAPWIVPLVFGKDYEQSILILQVILPGIIMLVIFRVLSGQLAGMGKPELAIYTFVPALAVNIGLNFWLIPLYGGLGAAIATNVSYALGSLAYWIVFARVCHIGYLEILHFSKEDARAVNEVVMMIKERWRS